MFSLFGNRIAAFFNKLTSSDRSRYEERSNPTSYVHPEWHAGAFINERNEVIKQMREEHEESGMVNSLYQCDELELALKKSYELVEFFCFDQHSYVEAFETIEQVKLFKVCTPLFILYSLHMCLIFYASRIDQ